MNLALKVKIPSKVKFLRLRLFLDRLPTRCQLSKRGLGFNVHERVCAFCFTFDENIGHLMFECQSSKCIWKEISVWLESDMLFSGDNRKNFLSSFTLLKGMVDKNRKWVIWMTTCWFVWNKRNTIMFKEEIVDISEVVFNIKLFSWIWLVIDSSCKLKCSFYKWYKLSKNIFKVS